MILSSLPSLAHARTHNNAFCCVFANSYKKNSKRRSVTANIGFSVDSDLHEKAVT